MEGRVVVVGAGPAGISAALALKDLGVGPILLDKSESVGQVELHDGMRLEPAAVVCATGYTPHLEGLVGHLGVLDDRGVPKERVDTPAAPGLRFIGYVPRPGALGYMAKEAKKAARAIVQELHTA